MIIFEFMFFSVEFKSTDINWRQYWGLQNRNSVDTSVTNIDQISFKPVANAIEWHNY